MLVIGLTGGIGSGKSTVADIFQQLGAPVIDTDVIARQLVEPGQPAFQEIVSLFDSILMADGQIDRSKLREIIFNDPDKRIELEKILHPRIQDTVKQMLSTISNDYVIIVIPLLTENVKWPFIDRVLVVDCDPQLQLERAMKRDATTAKQISKIMQTQASREQRLAIADDIIINEHDHKYLEKQVQDFDHKYHQFAQNIST